MPVNPPGSSIIVYTTSASATLFVEEVQYEFIIEPFERREFTNGLLRSVPTTTGAKPLIVTSFGGKPIQIGITCTGDSPRPLTPDDSNIDSIKQRFDIQRWTIRGAPNTAAAADQLITWATDHYKRLTRFQLHLEKTSMELSYTAISALQAENFSYLTSTGLNMIGDSIGGTATELLISQCNTDVAYEVTKNDNTKVLLKSWALTIENRVIKAQSSST